MSMQTSSLPASHLPPLRQPGIPILGLVWLFEDPAASVKVPALVSDDSRSPAFIPWAIRLSPCALSLCIYTTVLLFFKSGTIFAKTKKPDKMEHSWKFQAPARPGSLLIPGTDQLFQKSSTEETLPVSLSIPFASQGQNREE
ncbi:unnamed protein product [Pleuronectes platessa]|uniref:Uncharacterized protein n=1 Tax=Pleuronectes platessa TaxID=8262 RepID=A0A9N7VIP5_PLEPL|nr:unnamed protein product [Pleuronectes platessa]